MSGAVLQNLPMLHFLWALPVAVSLFIFAHQMRQRALNRFIEAGLQDRIPTSVSQAKRHLKAILLLLTMVLITLGLARPAWNPKATTIERRGRDVVFVLDVSRSMLAEDLLPNRLERAKIAIHDCLDVLQGDRVALVAFAGTAAVKCPLTLDYGFFKMMLDDISVHSISRGGTMIGDALRKTLDEVFDDQEKQYKDVILITDGEDHESFPLQAAEQAGERGIRLLAIGLGDENEGKRIPVVDESGHRSFLTYQGQEVWSRLDADTLRQMVNATPGGKYLNVATGAIDLGRVYLNLVASAEKRDLESKTIKRYEEKFQIFLGMSWILLAADLLMSERKRRRNHHVTS